LSKKYKLKEGVQLIVKEDGPEYKAYLIDAHTGFIAVGNKATHVLVQELEKQNDIATILKNIELKYPCSPKENILKSTDLIIQWLWNRDLIAAV